MTVLEKKKPSKQNVFMKLNNDIVNELSTAVGTGAQNS